jgi:hypothetical protein
MPGPGGSVSGPDNPISNEGAGYDSVRFTQTTDAVRITPAALETESVAIVVESGKVYIGFDDSVDDTSGTPITAGNGLSFNLDVAQEGIFGFADSVGTDVRWIALA